MDNYTFNYYQYKNKLNKKNHNFTILFLTIILLLGCIVFLKPIELKKHEIHFIQADEFQTYNDAKNFTLTLTRNGDNAYIYFEKNYHVLLSFHTSKKDAKFTLKNLKTTHKNASVFTIEKNKFSEQKSLTKSQNKTLENFVDNVEKISFKLGKLHTTFLKNSTDQNTALAHMKNIQKDYENEYDKFMKIFSKNPKFNNAKKHANNMLNCLSNLIKIFNEKSIKLINFEIISFVINSHQFLSSF